MWYPKRSAAIVLISIVLVAPGFSGPRAPQSVSALFGSRVIPNPRFKVPFLTGDLEGGGSSDVVYLVSISTQSPKHMIAPDVTILPDRFGNAPLGPRSEDLALAIVNGGSGRKYLLTGYLGPGVSSYFGSPIWRAMPVPLLLARRSSKPFLDFQKQEKRIRNDILVIGTEAGIDTALYWNGATYLLFMPNEEP